MTLSEEMVSFVEMLDFDRIPNEVIEKAKLHFLDTLGICLASSEHEFGKVVLDMASGLGDGEESTVIGFGKKLPVSSTAIVNGTLAHGLDFDDTHIEAIVHASAPITATALSVGELEKINGKGFLTALVAGLEVVCRMGMVAQGGFHDKGFHPTAICGTFAASLTAGKIMGYTPQAMVSAFGLCGSMAAGLLQIRESWLKRLHPGWAAHAGIVASRLGHHGFIGPRDILEGDFGLYRSHLGEGSFDWDLLTGDLGKRWEMYNISIKPYPCCHFTHAFLDCAKYLKEKYLISPGEIERVECKITDRLVAGVFEPLKEKRRPKLEYDAQFSVPYLVSAMLVKDRVDLNTIYREPYNDPEVLALADKVYWLPDPESDYPKHFPGEVSISLRDGRSFDRREVINRGGPGNPMKSEEIEGKFLSNASRLIGKKEAESIVRLVQRLEEVDDIGFLVEKCSAR